MAQLFSLMSRSTIWNFNSESVHMWVRTCVFASVSLSRFALTITSVFIYGFRNSVTLLFSSMSLSAIWNFFIGRSKVKVTCAWKVVTGQHSSLIYNVQLYCPLQERLLSVLLNIIENSHIKANHMVMFPVQSKSSLQEEEEVLTESGAFDVPSRPVHPFMRSVSNLVPAVNSLFMAGVPKMGQDEGGMFLTPFPSDKLSGFVKTHSICRWHIRYACKEKINFEGVENIWKKEKRLVKRFLWLWWKSFKNNVEKRENAFSWFSLACFQPIPKHISLCPASFNSLPNNKF